MAFLWTLLILLFTAINAAQAQCQAKEVGDSHTFTCDSSSTSNCPTYPLFRWLVILPNRQGTKRVSVCDDQTCTGNNEHFSVSLTSFSRGDSILYRSNLTIKSLSLSDPYTNEATWQCYHCTSRKLSCALKLFVKPKNPDCFLSEINNPTSGSLTKVNLTCTMEDVYPAGQCFFQVMTETDGAATTTDLSSTRNPTCVLLVDLNNMKLGDNTFLAKVKSAKQPGFETIEPITIKPSIRLYLPSTKIDCNGVEMKDGYLQGEEVNCSCVMTDPGKPRGEALWIRSNRILVESNGDTQAFYVMKRSAGIGLTYQCVGRSVLGEESPRKDFTPTFTVFREDGASIITSTLQEVYMPTDKLEFSCEMTASKVVPSPHFAMVVDRAQTTNFVEGQVWINLPTKSYEFQPLIGGNYTVGCRIANSVFHEMATDRVVNVTFYSSVAYAMAEASDNDATYATKLGPESKLDIRVEITSFPKPTKLSLFIGDPSARMTYRDFTLEFEQGQSASRGNVSLMMRGVESADLVSYTLVVGNGVGDNLNHSFILVEEEDSKVNVLTLVLGVVAGVALLVAMVILAVWYRRRKKTPSHTNNETTDVTNSYDQTDSNINDEHEYVDCDTAKNMTAKNSKSGVSSKPTGGKNKVKIIKSKVGKVVKAQPANNKRVKSPPSVEDVRNPGASNNTSSDLPRPQASSDNSPPYVNLQSNPMDTVKEKDVPPIVPPRIAKAWHANLPQSPGVQPLGPPQEDVEETYMDIPEEDDYDVIGPAAGKERDSNMMY